MEKWKNYFSMKYTVLELFLLKRLVNNGNTVTSSISSLIVKPTIRLRISRVEGRPKRELQNQYDYWRIYPVDH